MASKLQVTPTKLQVTPTKLQVTPTKLQVTFTNRAVARTLIGGGVYSYIQVLPD